MPKAKHCIECGAALPDAFPGGFCPACALRGALTSGGGEEAAGRKQKAEVGGQTPESASQGDSALRTPTSDLRPLAFGDYELLQEIARGGMGIVYRARQKSLNRIVALKMMLAGQFAKPEFVQRFRAEAEAIAQLQHPNIVAIHEVGEHDGQPYFSMDFVAGRTLAEIVREGPLPAPRAATYLKAIAEAVQYAHQRGILHRDLKPSNVLIDAADQPRITDFGLAKRLTLDSRLQTHELTLTGQVLGSPNYLSPEQAAGRQAEVGPASDGYALGAMLYHLVSGRPPFQADALTTLLRLVMETEPVAPRLLNASLPRDLETICLKCLEKEPSRRYASAQAVADELGRFVRSEPILARPVSQPEKVWRWCRRKPALAAALGAVVLVAAAGFLGILTQWRQAKASELFARQNAYAADMNLAQRALEANDVRLAVSLLNKHRPADASLATRHSSPVTDLRHWEWRYLWQRCQADESVRLQTNSGSNSVSIGNVGISQAGRVMAVETGDDKIVLWDLTTKRQMTELPGSAAIRRLVFSAAGDRLAVSTLNAREEPTVEVWDVPARKLRSTLSPPAPVRSLTFSPDGSLLATFDNQGNIAVMEWESHHTLTNFPVTPPRRGAAGVVIFSPDGSRLAIGEDYGRISLLNWRTGTSVTMTNLAQAGEGVTALAFSPTAELLAAAFGSASGTIRLCDVRSGELRGQLTNHTAVVRALVFTADGRRLASSSLDRTIRVWSVADQGELRCLRGHDGEGLALAFLPDGKTLVSGCEGGTACFWDATATNRSAGHTSLEISYKPGARSPLDAQSFAREAHNAKVVSRFGFTFPPGGQSFITTDPDGSLGVWDTRSVQLKESLPALGSNNWGVALSPDDHWLAVGNASGKVHIWDWRERRRVASFEVPFEWTGQMCFSRSGRYFWAGVYFNNHTSCFKIWRTSDWQEVLLAGVQVTDIWWADLSPDDRLLATGHAKGAVKVWDFPSGRHETTFTNQAGSVSAVVFSPEGRMLASTSMDGTVVLRNLVAHREVATLRGHARRVWGAAFSPDGRRLATGGNDARDAVKLWDLATQRELLSLHGEGEFFRYVTFSPDGGALMATSYAGIAHLWRAPSWAEIEAAEKGVLQP